MMSPQLSSDSQPPPRFLSALPQDDPRVGHGLGLPPASVLGAALTGVCVAWTAAAALLLSPVLSPLPVRFGDQSCPASDALGFPFSQLGSGSCLVAEHLQALPREALGPQPRRGGFGSPFCLASCLVRLSARGASFGSWHLAPRDSLPWDRRAGCVSCWDEVS